MNLLKRLWYKLTRKKDSIIISDKNEKILENDLILLISKLFTNGFYPNLRNYNSSASYWANFITAVCFAESGYNRFEKYMEPAPLYYYSLGLLQLSYVDQKHYPFCDIQGGKIFEPLNNIECGMGILDILVGKNSKPIFDKNHYWAVLKPSNKRHKVFLAKFNYLQGKL